MQTSNTVVASERLNLIKLLIFDHDMTIVDSSCAITEAINLAADELNKPRVTRETVLKFAAVPMQELLVGVWGEWRPEWIDLYRKKSAPIEHDLIRPFPDVPPTLLALKKAGAILAVASNRYDPKVAMDKSGMSQYFDAMIGIRDALLQKPNPAMLMILMERFSAAREETIYIGDSDIDAQTAHAAEVRFIGITTGFFSREQMQALGAWRILSTMSELLPLVLPEIEPYTIHNA